MNIYGTKGKVIKGEVLESLECAHCGNKLHRSFGVLRYFHLYGVPVFPIMKKVGIECTDCRWTLLGNQVPEKIRADISSNLFDKKHLLPMFAGSILMACLLGGGCIYV
jgi:DNA-directed RNA polymerase subunit RPC12/RpoP